MANVGLAAGLVMATSVPVTADVIVRLHSGSDFRATAHWVEGNLFKFEHRGGIVGFPREAIARISEAPAVKRRAVATAAPSAPASEGAEISSTEPAADSAPDDGVERPATGPQDARPQDTGGAATAASLVPEVPGEDLVTRQERLDRLAVETFQDLINARHREEPQEKLDALQAKFDEVNRQRAETLGRLKSIR